MSTLTRWVIDEEPPDVIVYADSASDKPRAKYINVQRLIDASDLLVRSLNLIESMRNGEIDSEDEYNEFESICYDAREQGLIV